MRRKPIRAGRIHARAAPVLLAVCTLTSPLSFATATETSEPGFQVVPWQREDGLPDNTITAIAQTPEGYLWLATPRGLARFDGARFTVFNTENTPVLRDSRITSLLADRDGSLWIGTDTGDLVRWHAGKFQRDESRAPVEGRRIAAFAEDIQGTLWFTTASPRGRPAAPGIVEPPSETNGVPAPVFSLVADTARRVWGWKAGRLCTVTHGVWGPVESELSLLPDAAPVIVPTHDGGLLLTTGNWWAAGISLLKLKNGNLDSLWGPGPWVKGSPRSRVTTMLEDRSGCLWLGTSGSGVYYARTNAVWHALAEQGPLLQNPINCLYEDREATVWIGTHGGSRGTSSRRHPMPRLPWVLRNPAG